mmetsp:Transcript_35585/g.111875  ORF Transcript_35585/g.111875 Transcript_35585/m.111875 type:complete len:337 (-) Transcript_35585:425-1435(-)
MADAAGLRQRRRASQPMNAETRAAGSPARRSSAPPQSQQIVTYSFDRIADNFLALFMAFFEVCMTRTPLGGLAESLGLREAAPRGRVPVEAEFQVLLAERELLSTAAERDLHEHYWRRLWAAWFRANAEAAPEFAVPSMSWPTMGFQGPDPLTDVRGGGLLALVNLVYFTENYPADVADMTARARRAEDGTDALGPEGPPTYPWAAAAIAISHCVAKLLHVARAMPGGAVAAADSAEIAASETTYWPLLLPGAAGEAKGADLRDIDNPQCREIFSLAFRRFDELWWAKSARYFQFPKVIMELHGALQQEFHSAAQRVERVAAAQRGAAEEKLGGAE